jgi:hypothetical protein
MDYLCLRQIDINDHSGDTGSNFLWNVDQYLVNYTAQHPRSEPF